MAEGLNCKRVCIGFLAIVGACAIIGGAIAILYFGITDWWAGSGSSDADKPAVIDPDIGPDSDDWRERLDDFDDDLLCPNEPPSPGPYLYLSEAQMIFFATQGTQKQRTANVDPYRYSPGYQRKEVRQLTDEEWDLYVQAVLATSNTFPGRRSDETLAKDFSQYQIFLALHNEANSPYAHEGSAFVLWHREYLLRFERTLRSHQPNVTIPYWDSSLDENLPDPRYSILFSDRFFGPYEGPLTSGRFANFPSVPACYCIGRIATRNASTSEERKLFNKFKFYDLSTKTSFRSFAFGDEVNKSENCLERYHDFVHVWLGGHMGEVPCAPTDPIFWSHHGFIDLMYEEFRERQSLEDRLNDYPDDIHADNSALSGHAPTQPMIPFEPLVNKQGLSNSYTGILYSYSKRPSLIDCRSDTDCGSRFLWCKEDDRTCVSKVHLNCTGLPDKACFCESGTSVCLTGQCSCE